jgi:cell division protein FtsL
MARNLTLRLNAVSHTLVSRNRRVSTQWRWGRSLVMALVITTAVVMFTSLVWAWGNLQCINQSYLISQAQETQKQYLDLNRKLRLELSNLTAISRLERLAVETYGMRPAQPCQVITVQ